MDALSSLSAARPIRFGTSGWRGIVGEDVTIDLHQALCRAVASWVLAQDGAGRRVVLGFDTRLMSERMARLAAQVFVEAGCDVIASHCAIGTPVLTHAIVSHGAAAGVMVTASHNPPEYHGVKVFGHWGGTIGDGDARDIEARLESGHDAPAHVPETWPIEGVDLVDRYLADVRSRFDCSQLGQAGFKTIYDAMHGAGAGLLDRLLNDLGVRVETLRAQRDPGFGGQAPDPVAEHLAPLMRAVKRGAGPCLGLATDGDADRFAVVEPGGRLLTETESLALLVDHLAETGRIERGVAVGMATGSLIEQVAADHGLAVSRWPVGFKHLSLAMLRGEADFAGDESGGCAWAPVGRDKDGILASLLMVDMMAREPGAIGAKLRGYERRFGLRACGRRSLPATRRTVVALERLREAPPERLGQDRVDDASSIDGLRLELPDGFAVLRASGTEPLVRLYAEASGASALDERLDLLEALLEKSLSNAGPEAEFQIDGR
jgi:phosphomannomutase